MNLLYKTVKPIFLSIPSLVLFILKVLVRLLEFLIFKLEVLLKASHQKATESCSTQLDNSSGILSVDKAQYTSKDIEKPIAIDSSVQVPECAPTLLLGDEKINSPYKRFSLHQSFLIESIKETEGHVLILGKAGTGKSYLIQLLRKKLGHRTAVVAFTGLAALHAQGQTIHKFFQFPMGVLELEKLGEKVSNKVALVLKNLEFLIIDEVFMVRADLFDAIDYRLRQVRKSELPFGGVRLILIGDPFQLVPVVEKGDVAKFFEDIYESPFFFGAKAWKEVEASFTFFELTQPFRQTDAAFLYVLDRVRFGVTDADTLSLLNKCVRPFDSTQSILRLCCTNSKVDEINQFKLEELEGDIFEFEAIVEGNFNKSYYPTSFVLKLKKGAQVMFVKNDKLERWVNGTLGIVSEVADGKIMVDIEGFVVSVEREVWEIIEYEYDPIDKKLNQKVVGSFKQYPLSLAWALTIHKAQGLTLERALIDLEHRAFAEGQVYVALSRVRDFSGLFLEREIESSDIKISQDALRFYTKKFPKIKRFFADNSLEPILFDPNLLVSQN